jgi:hypothetical protein
MNEESNKGEINETGTEQVADIIDSKETTKKKGWIQEMINREATPKQERTDTVKEFAEKWGIDESTYNYQRRKKENKRKIVEIWLNEATNGGNEVLQKLKENALAGKEKSMEMYLKFVLELAENLDIKSDGKALIVNVIRNGNKHTL